MDRPYILHFFAFQKADTLSIKAAVSSRRLTDDPKDLLSTPIEEYQLLKKNKFTLLLNFQYSDGRIESRTFETDNFGQLSLKLPTNSVSSLRIFETSWKSGVDLFLGEYTPIGVKEKFDIVISDFDKTLVETKYHSPKELYESLTSSVNDFPDLLHGINLLQSKIEKGAVPFILSSSPHFYESTIKHWAKNHSIEDISIILKDYRHFFSLLPGDLFPKDIKSHYAHKLNQLINVLLLIGVPDELTLIGDNSESDPLIYTIFSYLIEENSDPDILWRNILKLPTVKLQKFQQVRLLNRIYSLKNLVAEKKPKISIHIRNVKEKRFEVSEILQPYFNQINFYEEK